MKKTIRLTERDLHRVIKESVRRILKEGWEQDFWSGTKTRELENQLRSSAEFYSRTSKKYEGLDSELVKRYGIEDDAIEEIDTNGSLKLAILNGENTTIEHSFSFGGAFSSSWNVGDNKVIYQTDWYHISEDPENLYPKDELGNYQLKPNDGVVCIVFDRQLLGDYYKQTDSDTQTFYDEYSKHRKEMPNRDEQMRLRREKEEQEREAERQRVIQRITPPSDEVKAQMDKMWKRRNTENKPDLDSKRSERRFKWNDRGSQF